MKVPPPCPESVQGFHSPANPQGCCTWCGIKVETVRRPRAPEVEKPTEVDEAYALRWDPDGWP